MNKIDINLNPQKENVSSDIAQSLSAYVPLLSLGIAFVFVAIVLLQFFAFQKQHSHNVYKKKWAEWQDEDTLLTSADSYMYKAKSEGKNRYVCSSIELD